jgi:DNA-binding transcriptional MocR family regulator
MAFQPSRVRRPREQVEEQIREAILSGAFRQGDKLPSETQLAEQFSVSRTTVREALRALAAAGLISKVPGVAGGSFVQSVEIGVGRRRLGGGVVRRDLLALCLRRDGHRVPHPLGRPVRAHLRARLRDVLDVDAPWCRPRRGDHDEKDEGAERRDDCLHRHAPLARCRRRPRAVAASPP